MHSFLHFSRAIDVVRYLYNNTKENFLWEPEEINVKFHKMTPYTWNFQNFVCVFTILVKFGIYFLGLPWELIVFGVITDNLIILIALEKRIKRVKKNAIFFKLSWYKVLMDKERPFPSSHCPPHNCYFLIIAIFIGIPSGCLCGRESIPIFSLYLIHVAC